MIWLLITWAILWVLHGCTVEKLLKKILKEMKKPKEG